MGKKLSVIIDLVGDKEGLGCYCSENPSSLYLQIILRVVITVNTSLKHGSMVND